MSDFVVRDHTPAQSPGLYLYRKFDRSNSLGRAWPTESGFWIVSVTRKSMNVAKDRREAFGMLLRMAPAQ